MIFNRRKFVKKTLAAASIAPFFSNNLWSNLNLIEKDIKISLQCVSFANKLMSGEMSILDFPKIVREDFNIEAAEYWNIPFLEKRSDSNFIKEMNKRTSENGLKNTIMLVDLFDLKTRESKSISHVDKNKRIEAIDEHKRWIEFAKSIGCESIRLNLWTKEKDPLEVKKVSQEGLNQLLEYSTKMNMSIVIENHGGFTSDASWLVDLIQSVDHPRLGTLPDFGTLNFCIERAQSNNPKQTFSNQCINQYDKYKGVEQMLPYAKGISAKSISFKENGEEENTDFGRMIDLIKSYSFKGYMSIEYEGALMVMFGRNSSDYLSSHEGIKATKKLIEKHL